MLKKLLHLIDAKTVHGLLLLLLVFMPKLFMNCYCYY